MTNPLTKYYRIPGINITIPSKGCHQPEDNISFTLSNEVEVFPMKASDELLLKSPDALISGKALESMIESCVPGVKNVRALPYNDVDALLVAIRSATYGEQLEVNDTCPECGEEQVFEINLPFMLETMSFLKSEYPLKVSNDVTIYLRPLSFAEQAVSTKRMYEEARRIQMEMAAPDLSDEEKHNINARAYDRMHALNIEMLATAIDKIVTPEGETTEFEYILEFVSNAPMQWFKDMEEVIKEIASVGIDKSKLVECGNCSHSWETNVVFDPASFFKIGS